MQRNPSEKVPLSILQNATLEGIDGTLGKIKDFLFDDQQWVLRYLEVNTGNWLFGRRVLISPFDIESFSTSDSTVRVNLTKAQIEAAPGLETDQPVSRQYEQSYANHFRHHLYWLGGGLWGSTATPSAYVASREAALIESNEVPAQHDAHLRLWSEVTGYQVREGNHALVGKLDDFVVRLDNWRLDYLQLNSDAWPQPRKLLLPTSEIHTIDWVDQRVNLFCLRDVLEDLPAVTLPLSIEAEAALQTYFEKKAS